MSLKTQDQARELFKKSWAACGDDAFSNVLMLAELEDAEKIVLTIAANITMARNTLMALTPLPDGIEEWEEGEFERLVSDFIKVVYPLGLYLTTAALLMRASIRHPEVSEEQVKENREALKRQN